MILNKEQELAVNTTDKHVFLLAGAGSGKTRVIVERIKKLLINENPEDILCITFTVKSAEEMKKRINNEKVFVSTFHAYCYSVLSNEKELNIFQSKGDFSQQDLLKIANYKNSLMSIDEPKNFKKYQSFLKDSNQLDFDDLLISALDIEHKKFKYIFIDEFQDTNLLQFELLNKMYHSNQYIFAVGDPDQSIYKFRGSKIELIEKFVSKYQAKVLKLEENFRSNKAIISASNQLIKNNINRFKKTLFTRNETVGFTHIFYGSEQFLTKQLIDTIKKYKFKDIAILYRNHYQVTKLKQDLERHYIFTAQFYSFHEAKGLEFKTVIIFGAHILPYDKSNTFSQTEEERRLLFVAVTRAKENLLIFSHYPTKFIKQLKINSITKE